MLCSVARFLLAVQVCLLLVPLCSFTNSVEIGDSARAELMWTTQDLAEEDEKAAALAGTEGGPGQLAFCCRPLAISIQHAAATRCALPECFRADVPSPPPLPA